MKETIEYYYNLNIDELFIEKDNYHFIIDKEDYYFTYFYRTKEDLNDIIECTKELINKGINVHEFLLNINKEYLTKIDDANYILVKVKNKDNIISINDMNYYNNKLTLANNKYGLYRNDWALLWSKKIDYIEDQIKQLNIKNIAISSTIDYYIGLTENAIYYVNMISQKFNLTFADKIVLSRKRIYYPNYNLNYFNPLTFIFDLEVRDICEYIKSAFFYGEDAFLELESYLKYAKLSIYSYNMLFARLLYPSYYFDLYEQIINKNQNDDLLLKIIAKNKEYEIFLKKAYDLISSYAPLENINWLKN